MSKIHDKMRKLLALAERGEGGEKDNAQRMLEKMMEKYGISLDDLGVETTSIHYWNYDSMHERTILFQTFGKVCNTSEITYYKGDRKCGFELTPSQYIEMDLHYSILRKDLKKHIERAVRAFIHANELFSNHPSEKQKEYTQEELEEIEAMLRMARSIAPSQVNRQLEYKA
jgi:hypothetical protein